MSRTAVITTASLLVFLATSGQASAQWHTEDADRWSNTVNCSGGAGWQGHTVRVVSTLEEAPAGSGSTYHESDSGNQSNVASASIQRTMGSWLGEVKCWTDVYFDDSYTWTFSITIPWPNGDDDAVASSSGVLSTGREQRVTFLPYPAGFIASRD